APDTANATRQIAIRFDSKSAEPAGSIDKARLEAKKKAEEQALSTEKRFTVTTSDGPVTTSINPEPLQLVEQSKLRILEEQLEKLQRCITTEIRELQAVEQKETVRRAGAPASRASPRAAVAA